MTEIASVVLFSAAADRTARFYEALGVRLDHETHDQGPTHFAAELGGVHFAIYASEGSLSSPAHHAPGEVFVGLYVDSLDDAFARLEEASAPIVGGHERMPWGCRFLCEDPDGRTVEVNDRSHSGCSEEIVPRGQAS